MSPVSADTAVGSLGGGKIIISGAILFFFWLTGRASRRTYLFPHFAQCFSPGIDVPGSQGTTCFGELQHWPLYGLKTPLNQ